MKAEPHPIDFGLLDRGSVVPATAVTAAYGHEPGTTEFQFDRMRLIKLIKEYFYQELGEVVSASCKGDAIRILTHEEQDVYVQQQKRQAIRAWVRRHEEDMGTDENYLDDEAKKRRQRRLITDSWKKQQLFKRKPPELKKAAE